MDDEPPSYPAGALDALRDESRPDVIRIGTIPRAVLEYWSNFTTLEVIVTRERRRHYLERHPEVFNDEPVMLDTLAHPTEVHRNKLDGRIAIFYSRIDTAFYLRIAVWVSDRTDRHNSVLSLRRARAREVVSGRSAGRLVWKE